MWKNNYHDYATPIQQHWRNIKFDNVNKVYKNSIDYDLKPFFFSFNSQLLLGKAKTLFGLVRKFTASTYKFFSTLSGGRRSAAWWRVWYVPGREVERTLPFTSDENNTRVLGFSFFLRGGDAGISNETKDSRVTKHERPEVATDLKEKLLWQFYFP